jgi:hypothetical protein
MENKIFSAEISIPSVVALTAKKQPHLESRHPRKMFLCCYETRWRLVEAHWSHVDSVFRVSVVDLAWSEVDDWKSDVFVLVEFEDG